MRAAHCGGCAHGLHAGGVALPEQRVDLEALRSRVDSRVSYKSTPRAVRWEQDVGLDAHQLGVQPGHALQALALVLGEAEAINCRSLAAAGGKCCCAIALEQQDSPAKQGLHDPGEHHPVRTVPRCQALGQRPGAG